MKVKLIAKTQNMLDVVYVGARTCYNAGSPIDMHEDIENISEDKKLKLVKSCIELGHDSVLEHTQFTFAIEGMSKASSVQLLRHRHASFSQQSQRYCTFQEDKLNYVVPVKIKNNTEALNIFQNTMNIISKAYSDLLELGIPAEDSRAVLPNACETNLVVTLNLREFMHICSLRLCSKSQLEIRQVVKEMKNKVIEDLPWLEEYLQPKCVRANRCNEKNPCGYYNNFK